MGKAKKVETESMRLALVEFVHEKTRKGIFKFKVGDLVKASGHNSSAVGRTINMLFTGFSEAPKWSDIVTINIPQFNPKFDNYGLTEQQQRLMSDLRVIICSREVLDPLTKVHIRPYNTPGRKSYKKLDNEPKTFNDRLRKACKRLYPELAILIQAHTGSKYSIKRDVERFSVAKLKMEIARKVNEKGLNPKSFWDGCLPPDMKTHQSTKPRKKEDDE